MTLPYISILLISRWLHVWIISMPNYIKDSPNNSIKFIYTCIIFSNCSMGQEHHQWSSVHSLLQEYTLQKRWLGEAQQREKTPEKYYFEHRYLNRWALWYLSVLCCMSDKSSSNLLVFQLDNHLNVHWLNFKIFCQINNVLIWNEIFCFR